MRFGGPGAKFDKKWPTVDELLPKSGHCWANSQNWPNLGQIWPTIGQRCSKLAFGAPESLPPSSAPSAVRRGASWRAMFGQFSRICPAPNPAASICPSSLPRPVRRAAIWRANVQQLLATPAARRGSMFQHLWNMLQRVEIGRGLAGFLATQRWYGFGIVPALFSYHATFVLHYQCSTDVALLLRQDQRSISVVRVACQCGAGPAPVQYQRHTSQVPA